MMTTTEQWFHAAESSDADVLRCIEIDINCTDKKGQVIFILKVLINLMMLLLDRTSRSSCPRAQGVLSDFTRARHSYLRY